MASEYIGEGDEHAMAFDKEDIVELHVPDVAPLSAAPVQNGMTKHLLVIHHVLTSSLQEQLAPPSAPTQRSPPETHRTHISESCSAGMLEQTLPLTCHSKLRAHLAGISSL